MSTFDQKKEPSWLEFEKEVSEVLELAGYEVERDVLVAGGQTDIIARKKNSVPESRILVECKYTESNSSVAVDDVENFNARIQMLRNIDKVDSGFLITNHKFSRYAKQAKTTSYIHLLTIDQLRRNIFNFTIYLKDLTDQKTTIRHPLIKPLYSPYGGKSEPSSTNYKGYDLLEFLLEASASSDGKRLCILGDYGLGKTTSSLWFASILADQFLNSPDNTPIPILVPLWRYTKSINVQALITDYIVNDCGIPNFRFSTFVGLLESGVFLLILDGFDEMARHVDEEVRYRNFADLSSLAKGKAKIILTGRPSYFPNEEELGRILSLEEESIDIYEAARDALDELAGYELIKLDPLNETQVDEYIRQATANNTIAEKMIQVIRGTYDLYELASRPVLLEMMVKTLPEILKKEASGPTNAAKLYQLYTGQWIDREHKKGEFRKLIGKKNKLLFMQELAYQLFIESKQSICPSELGNPIKRFFDINESDILDYFSHDIRTCSFLERKNNEYRFAHSSFQEYFAAYKLIEDANISLRVSWETTSFPPQIIRFASEILGNTPEVIPKIIAWAKEEANSTCAKNALVVLAFGGTQLSEDLQDKIGMPVPIFTSYAAYVLGDTKKSEVFANHLFKIISQEVKKQKVDIAPSEDFEEDDITTDTFLNLFGSLQTKLFHTVFDLSDIVQRSVRNSVVHIKHENSFFYKDHEKFLELNTLVDIPDPRPTELEFIIKREKREAFERAINQLPAKYNTAIGLHYLEELSVTEIATHLSISSSAAKVIIKRAYQQLRIILKNDKTQPLNGDEGI